MNFDEVLEENRRRNDAIREANRPYDSEFAGPLDPERCKTDFRYWAARAVTIRHKQSGRMVPFVLNAAQLEVLETLEEMRLANRPIRLILLKARQWGGSTLIQMYMAWIQLVLRRNWHSVICAHIKDSARNIRAMYSNLLAGYPEALCKDTSYRLRSFERAQNISVIEGRDCRITVASAESQDSIRGADIALAHLTEVAFWKDSVQHSPEDFMRAVCSSVPLEPLTLVAIESTANGVGNFFHTEWLRACDGLSDKKPVFIPWYKIAMYRMEVENPSRLWDTLNDYERRLWDEFGCSLEQICWYRRRRSEYPSDQLMQAEFPTTPTEAFASTGTNVFPIEQIDSLRKHCFEAQRGELGDDGFTPSPTGCLEVWRFPDPSAQYIAVVDVGGRSETADWSVIAVIRNGERPEVVAQWRGHTYHDILADKAMTIARFYNTALLVVESNTLETSDESSSSATVLQHIATDYPNTYFRQLTSSNGDDVTRVGFHTNRHTKALVVDALSAALREGRLVEHSSKACDEFATYRREQNGTYSARKGCHDDILITRAIAMHILRRNPELLNYGPDTTPDDLRWQW